MKAVHIFTGETSENDSLGDWSVKMRNVNTDGCTALLALWSSSLSPHPFSLKFRVDRSAQDALESSPNPQPCASHGTLKDGVFY